VCGLIKKTGSQKYRVRVSLSKLAALKIEVSADLHAEEFLCAPAGLAEEACGMTIIHKDNGVVLVCKGLK